MNRRQKIKASATMTKEHAEALSHVYGGLKLGSFEVPGFTALDATFGAGLKTYPPMAMIPAEFQTWSGKYQDIVSSLFFKGGRLEDHNIKLRTGIDHKAAMTAIRAWMGSFAPKHEHKTATVAWALSEWTEPLTTHHP